MSVEFGRPSWPFEKSNSRLIKTEVIQVPNTIGVNISVLYYQRIDGLGISLQANIPLYHWGDPEIQEPVRKFLKIEDPNDIDVRSDQFAQVVRFDFRKHTEPLNYPLIHH